MESCKLQRCDKCGQLNDNYEERCIYCGEYLYISVDQDDNHYKVQDDFTNEIIEELTNNNNEAMEFLDINDNPFTKSIEENLFDEEDDEYTEEIDFINDSDNDFHDLEITRDTYIEDQSYDNFKEDEKIEDKPRKKKHLIELEEDLKRKIKRNKKLENSIGITFRDIEVCISSLTNPIEISGKAFINPNNSHDEYKLSIICYDVLKNKLERKEVLLNNKSSDNYVDFNVLINPNIHKTAMIILLPEIIESTVILEELEEDSSSQQNNRVFSVKDIFIEQMTEIERKIGMKISNTSIILKNNKKIEIVGEIYIENPDKYNTIKITATCYDKNNNIIATESTKINTKLYLGFDTLKLVINNVNISKIQRIKLYPTLQGLD